MSRFSMFDFKMAALEILSGVQHENKTNLIGRSYQKGKLELHLQFVFTDDERALASQATEELKHSGLIRPTFKDVIAPEDWWEITDTGRQALQRRALDDLDAALQKIDPKLCEIRHGAAHAAISEQPDAMRQAAHSMRELIRQVLNTVAPIKEVRAQPGFCASKEVKSGVTLKMQTRQAIKKRPLGFSDSDVEYVEGLCRLVDTLYDKLSAEAHRKVEEQQRDVNDLIASAETAYGGYFCSASPGAEKGSGTFSRTKRSQTPLHSEIFDGWRRADSFCTHPSPRRAKTRPFPCRRYRPRRLGSRRLSSSGARRV